MADQPTTNLRIASASVELGNQWFPAIYEVLGREQQRQVTLTGKTDDKQHPTPIIVSLYESDQYPELDAGHLSDGSWSANIYLPPAAFESFWQIALVRRSLEVRISLGLNDTGQPTNILFLALGDPETENPVPTEL